MNDDGKTRVKSTIPKLAAVFIGVMLLLTFFSNTINNFSLPRVKTEMPASGSLHTEITAQGQVEEVEAVNLYASSDRKVLDVCVQAGSHVKKGDVIMILDRESMEKKLEEETILLGKTRLSLNELLISEPGAASEDERAIKQAEARLAAAEKNLDASKSLFASGALSGKDLEKARNEYDSARMDHEKVLKDASAGKTGRQMDIEGRQYDLRLQEMKVEAIRKMLSEESEIKAPFEGIVREINFEKGAFASPSTPLCTVVNTGKGFRFRATLERSSAGLLSVDDTAFINLKAFGNSALEGKITEIKDNPDNRGEEKVLLTSIPQDGLTGGEPGYAAISKQSRRYKMLVSNSAVGEDMNGKFVYVLKENKGPLGNEYYLQKAYITVADEDNLQTAVASGLEADEKVIVRSSKDSLSDGCRVMPER